MTPDFATQWIAYATRQPVELVQALELSPSQAATLGEWLSKNRLLNPPTPREIPLKTGRFLCQCGCGEWFERDYRTMKPKYKNPTHRQRAYRARVRQAHAAVPAL